MIHPNFGNKKPANSFAGACRVFELKILSGRRREDRYGGIQTFRGGGWRMSRMNLTFFV
jgi:hypothetical protein